MNARRILGGAAALALLAAPVSAQTVKIGLLTTFSGPGGAGGQHMLDGLTLGIEHVGGKLGGLTPEIVKEDDQLKPDVGLQAAQKLLERDKVDIMTGVIFSNVMMAVYKPVIDSETIFIGMNAGPSQIAGKQCSPYFFSTSWQNDQPHEAMGKYLQDKGVKRVYLMAPNYQAGKDALTGFKRYYKGEIVAEVYTQVNQPDYAAEIAQLRAAKPEAVYVFYPLGMGVNYVKQYAQAGLSKEIPLYSAFTVDPINIEGQGEAAVGTFQTQYWNYDLKNPANEKFAKDFVKKFGYLPSNYAAQAYDTALLLDSALKAVKGNLKDKKALIAALEKADYASVRGPHKFNKNHFPIENFYLVETVKGADGKIVQETRATVFENHQDAYVKDCAMK